MMVLRTKEMVMISQVEHGRRRTKMEKTSFLSSRIADLVVQNLTQNLLAKVMDLLHQPTLGQKLYLCGQACSTKTF